MQQVIDGILYSPVNAHALRKGDLFTFGTYTAPWRLLSPPEQTDEGEVLLIVGVGVSSDGYCHAVGINEPVLRAVGPA